MPVPGDYTVEYQGVGTVAWVVPENCFTLKLVQGWGHGGAGSRAPGGGGAWARKADIPTTPGETLTFIVVNTQVANFPSLATTHTEIRRGSTVLFRAASGSHGNAGVGGTGGQAANCIADLAYSGGNGGSSIINSAGGAYYEAYGGGGGSASPSGNGFDGGGAVAGGGFPAPGSAGNSSSGATNGQSNVNGGAGGRGGTTYSSGDDYVGNAGSPGGGIGGGSYGASMYGTVWAGQAKLNVVYTVSETGPSDVIQPVVQVITTTGSGSVTVPAGYNTVVAEVWSAGQAGWVEGGGHGGNYVRTAPTNVTPGSPISYNIGAAANPQQYSQPNAADSWVWSATTLLAKGGGHRSGNIGAVSYYGGLGDRTNYQQGGGGYPPGGGGGAAHPLGNGSNAVSYNGAASGTAGGASGSRAGGGYQNAGISNVEGGSGGGSGTSGAGGAPGGGSGGHASGTAGAAGRGQIRFTFTYDASAEPVAPTRKPPRASTIQ